MGKYNFLLKYAYTLVFFLSICTGVQAQLFSDIPQQQNRASFDLLGNIQEITTYEYDIEIDNISDTLKVDDSTHILTKITTLTFDSVGNLQKEVSEEYTNKGKLKDSYSTIITYNGNHQTSAIKHYKNDELQHATTYSYNSDNQLEECISLNKKNKQVGSTLYFYKKSRVFNIKIKDEDNVMQNFIRLHYNSKGLIKEREYRGATMQILNSQKYVRDKLGDGMTRTNIYDYAADGILREMNSYQYDKYGNNVQHTITDSNKRVVLYSTINYNKQKEPIKKVDFSNDIKDEKNYKYIYDEHSNWIAQYIYHDERPVGLKKRSITYYTKEDK